MQTLECVVMELADHGVVVGVVCGDGAGENVVVFETEGRSKQRISL